MVQQIVISLRDVKHFVGDFKNFIPDDVLVVKEDLQDHEISKKAVLIVQSAALICSALVFKLSTLNERDTFTVHATFRHANKDNVGIILDSWPSVSVANSGYVAYDEPFSLEFFVISNLGVNGYESTKELAAHTLHSFINNLDRSFTEQIWLEKDLDTKESHFRGKYLFQGSIDATLAILRIVMGRLLK